MPTSHHNDLSVLDIFYRYYFGDGSIHTWFTISNLIIFVILKERLMSAGEHVAIGQIYELINVAKEDMF